MTTRALLVTSSILGDNGQSNALASHFQQQAAARDGVAVTHRDVVANALPHLAIEELGAWQTPADERTTEQQALAAHSDELLAELRANDVLVLAVPMYNLGIPSQLKAWFDRVLRAGETFRYTENGPQGLIEGKRAIILAARGGQYAGTEFDSQTPHLKTMLGLMGIRDVEVVFAEGLNMGDAHRDAAMKEAFQAIDQLVEAL
ncbi:MAG: NAD(P)H-dependent oxidoreductase [Halomonas sp.]|jgi:FMN-dependent NADH-azoreductase|uniref:FMN-dependent NADH-azoreductase n=1 Tax=Halomonadaceae TaxID=28256 RepID=UPI0005CC4C45|nr:MULTISPECIES: NAD(P)H-dependent oxidoreductase [Halomonas]KTG27598.1 FMN-dependent NADH-azoreductase [Idiomarina sp. H105]MEC9020873.1 NAD(P)H-dependent oxidoreductase [Pseudomonadota bacterium]OAF03795.1 FMN-dependent NADH-azoreductase [Idiomarina sp. WRN-38]KJD20268.1 FMN-dependent NADH-azoreductase [Halomonas meridiana]MAD22521.1 FMN-dependent NADH-azoreductase [Halomonas sp.]|tara:strand:- start:8573 stop:9181 length:609 start_codon:yes stop_codon:yes gene_type:complete